MEKFNRAERRFQIERLKAKRKHYWGYGKPHAQTQVVGYDYNAKRIIGHRLVIQPGVSEMNPRQLGGVIQHPQSCSCYMSCANARKMYGRSLAELRFFDLAQEQLREFFEKE